MKTLHLLGHTPNWNLDSHFENGIGDGFVFTGHKYPNGFLAQQRVGSYGIEKVLGKSFLDLQFYAKRGGINLGNLKSYPFHPANVSDDSVTNVYVLNSIKEAIRYQVNSGLSNVIIPNYYENDSIKQMLSLVIDVNKWLSVNKAQGVKYFMTIPLGKHIIIDRAQVDELLAQLTHQRICFDGYYIMCEAKAENRQKLNIEIKVLNNLTKVFKTFAEQDFETIYAYANWDAMIYASLANINYVTIGTYETLRKFSIDRFVKADSGGPSKGWYYSEVLLNVVKAQLLDLVRHNGGIDLISNRRNVFSDYILSESYEWSNNKPHVHKNYLLSVDRQIKEIGRISSIKERKEYTINLIDAALEVYKKLEGLKIVFNDESEAYHLGIWRSFLQSK